jgi:hypothetical protein
MRPCYRCGLLFLRCAISPPSGCGSDERPQLLQDRRVGYFSRGQQSQEEHQLIHVVGNTRFCQSNAEGLPAQFVRNFSHHPSQKCIACVNHMLPMRFK